MRTIQILLVLFCLFLSFPTDLLAQPATGPRIAFAAFKAGQWDIFTISPDGEDLRQLTNDPYDDESPAYAPDGQQLAYASRRAGNWDIYLLDLSSGTETRLTNHPEYDGAPAWRPDGQQIAFESYRSRDLDIWLTGIDPAATPLNLTGSSPAGDFDPAWGADGQTLFFVSWRAGNNDIWALNLDSGAVEPWTTAQTADSQPAWNAQANELVFTRNDLGDEDLVSVAHDPMAMRPWTWLGSVEWPALSPDGQVVVGVYRTPDGSQLIRFDPGDPVPHFLTEKAVLGDGLSWQAEAINVGVPIITLLDADDSALYTESLTPSSSPTGEPYDLIRINDLRVGSPWLADTVDDSFQALRQRVRTEVGYDFLGELSDVHRGINFSSEDSQYSSWHKSGRAIDTLFELPGDRMEIVRQNMGGETYWRILLRCEDQSGSCGQPITVNPWDYSYEARNLIAPEQGGIEKPNQYGYYLDFTTLAEIYGWERISSYDDEDFSWTWHFKAFEYWHYQKRLESHRGAGNWYQAMVDVYPPNLVKELLTWDKMRAANEDPYLIVLKGIPLLPEAERWQQALMTP